MTISEIKIQFKDPRDQELFAKELEALTCDEPVCVGDDQLIVTYTGQEAKVLNRFGHKIESAELNIYDIDERDNLKLIEKRNLI